MNVGPATSSAGRAGEVRFPVSMPDGVRCAECIERLRAAVGAVDGVHTVIIDPRTWTIAVTFDPGTLTAEEVEAAAREHGLEIGAAVAHAAYRLTGLD